MIAEEANTHSVQDVAEALRRLPPDVVIARNCRLRRALDLSCKHEGLPADLLAKQTPENSYLLVSKGGGVATERGSRAAV